MFRESEPGVLIGLDLSDPEVGEQGVEKIHKGGGRPRRGSGVLGTDHKVEVPADEGRERRRKREEGRDEIRLMGLLVFPGVEVDVQDLEGLPSGGGVLGEVLSEEGPT